MDKLDFDTLLYLVKDYLLSQNIDKNIIHKYITKNNIISIYYKKLSSSDIFKENRINKKSNETHIAITGNSMKLFFGSNEIVNISCTSKYYFCDFFIFSKNLSQLMGQNVYHKNKKEIISSISSVHISKRTKGAPQVAFGLKSNSTQEFIDFRKSLYLNDLLLIMRTIKPQKYFIIGASAKVKCPLNNRLNKLGFIENKIFIDPKISKSYEIQFNYNDNNVLDIEKKNLNCNLQKTSVDEIATYKVEEINYSKEAKSGISQRIKRYILHQQLVTKTAEFLEKKGFILYKGQIDCLAQKKDCITLIMEMKTLDGTLKDEVNQVRAALAQLIYYNKFSIKPFNNDKRLLVAVFNKKPNISHIQFLEENNIEVMYKNKDGVFEYTSIIGMYFDNQK